MCNSYKNLATLDSARDGARTKLRLDADATFGHDSYARLTVGTSRTGESIEINREAAALLRDTLTAMLAAQDVTEAAYNTALAPQPYSKDSLAHVRESGNEVLVSTVNRAADYVDQYA